MRQRIAEKQKERKLAAEQDQIKQTHVVSAAGGDGAPVVKEEKPQSHLEEQHEKPQLQQGEQHEKPQKEQHERPHWGAQPVAPIAFAQQPEATGRVTDG